jgi:phosphohistidine phosphatase SixA
MHRRAFVGGLSGCVLLGACGVPRSQSARGGVIGALRGGGLVVYFRHGATIPSKEEDFPDWPRERQRLLSDEGIAQSRRIGRRFRELGLPVDEVRSSPFLRCLDMAGIAFGGATVDDRLISSTSRGGPSGRVAHLRGLLSTPWPGLGNLVLISHVANITAAAGVALVEGEALVVRPLGKDGFRPLGRVAAAAW